MDVTFFESKKKSPLLQGKNKLEDSIFDLNSENVDRTEVFVIDTPHVVS